jgi:pyruvate/2-oxoglutarate dehydrogenase complex dihydrolipoamide acyltransferase (E2) component
VFLVAPPGAAPASSAAPSPATKATKASPPKKAASKYVDVELTNMRKTIAKRLTQSKVLK